MNIEKKVSFNNKVEIKEYILEDSEKIKKINKNKITIQDRIISNILYKYIQPEKEYVYNKMNNKKVSLDFIQNCYYRYQHTYQQLYENKYIKIIYKHYLIEINDNDNKIKVKILVVDKHNNNLLNEKNKEFPINGNIYLCEYKSKKYIINYVRKVFHKLSIF